MTKRTVTTQAELNAALAESVEHIIILAPSTEWLNITDSGTSKIEIRGRTRAEIWWSTCVEAWDSSRVEAWDRTHVVAGDQSHVVTRDESRVDAGGSALIWARDRSHVEAGPQVTVRVYSRQATVNGGIVTDLTDLTEYLFGRHHREDTPCSNA